MLVARRISLALGVASLLAVPLASPAFGTGPTVTVRVEGASGTLLQQTTVTLNTPEPVSGCPASSAAAAINLAVNGNWDHGEANNGGGDFTQTILGETHAFTHESDTWAEWIDYKWGGGVCSDLLSNGDEVLMVADHEPEPFFAPTVLPLVVGGAPASAQVGVPFTLNVSEIRTALNAFAGSGEGISQPAAGATVSGGGAMASTGANGVATISLATLGTVTLTATKAGDAPSAPFAVCVHASNDGTCGTTAPSASGAPAAAGSGTLGAKTSVGPKAIVADLTGLIDGHRYRRGDAPRVLAGSVTAPASVASISLRLRRTYRGRCWAYDGKRERFLRVRCRKGSFFRVAPTGDSFSYLLPSRLQPGRYVLDIKATDAAGNHTALVRGTSRIVFYVA
jgi:hypothetical protein